MRPRTMVCPSCARSWSGRDVRFCGACGEPLVPAGAPRSSRLAHVVRRAAAGTSLVVVGALLATTVVSDRAPDGAVDPGVELSDEPLGRATDALTDEEAETLLQQVDPGRLRCEPRGCELWRRERGPLSGVAAVDALVVVLEGNELIALDGATGERRWAAPVGHLRSFTSDGQQIRSTSGRGWIAASPDGQGVFLVTGTEVSLVGLDGDRRWSQRPDPTIEWQAATLPDALLLHGTEGAGRATQLVALDLATGNRRWTAHAESVQVVERDVIVVTTADRRLRAMDPATGSTMWERTPRLSRWAQSAGPWIAHHAEQGLVLLDRDTGEVAGTITGYLTEPVAPAGDLWLAVVASNTAGWTVQHTSPLAVVALRRDASVAWQLPLDPDQATGCCSLLVSDDERTVTIAGALRVLTADAATGFVVSERVVDEKVDTASDLAEEVHAGLAGPGAAVEAADGTVLRWRHSGELVVSGPNGAIVIRGREVWVESLDPLVVGSPEHLMGVRAVPPP